MKRWLVSSCLFCIFLGAILLHADGRHDGGRGNFPRQAALIPVQRLIPIREK